LSNRREGNQVFGAGAPPVGVQTRDVMKDDFGFEIPVESVPLPSGGAIYPQDSALHNAKTIDIRAMTAREEDILTSRALIKKGTVISSLLQSCIVEKGVEPSKMIVGDRNAVMIALRITGYGSEYEGEVDCPSCGAKSKQSFDLSSLSIKPLQIEPSRPGENVFEFFLPVSKKTVQFKFLTGADEEEILVMQERKKKLGGNADSFVTTRLHFALVSVDGKTDRSLIASFVRSMPARDSLALRTFIDENEPGVDMSVEFECPSCGETSEVSMPIGATFFWPNSK
jgi:hypothetical protein